MGNKQLRLSFIPHIRDKASTRRIMFDVVLALFPCAAFGVYNFGLQALIIIVTCVASCIVFEVIWNWLLRRKNTLGDLTAIITGIILALNLPPTIPFWIAIIGSAFAIFIVKMLFGGLGQNIVNPALGAKCFLLLSFAGPMNTFVYQNIQTATPAEIINASGNVDILQLLFGNTAGCIGETCALAVLLGAIYLLARRIIDYRIPLFYLLTVIVFVCIYSIFTRGGIDATFLVSHLLSGGILFGAFFMATDYVTCPITTNGKIIYGIIVGILTCVFKIFGNPISAVAYAIIFGNLISPLLEKMTQRKSFGKGAH